MKAALPVEPGKIEIREVPTPVPGEGDVLIRIVLAGVCGTDYALYSGEIRGRLPLIPGHEAAGQVAALGTAVKSLAVGQHVTFQPNFPCAKCEPCREGRGNVCLQKIRLGLDVHGIFAQYVAVPPLLSGPCLRDYPMKQQSSQSLRLLPFMGSRGTQHAPGTGSLVRYGDHRASHHSIGSPPGRTGSSL